MTILELQKKLQEMYEKYGDVIKCRNKISKIFSTLQYFKFIMYMIAFSGWGVATAVVLYHFLLSK